VDQANTEPCGLYGCVAVPASVGAETLCLGGEALSCAARNITCRYVVWWAVSMIGLSLSAGSHERGHHAASAKR